MHDHMSVADGEETYISFCEGKDCFVDISACVKLIYMLSQYSSIAFLLCSLRYLYSLNIIGLY